ncbi:MAG: uridine kinase [Bacteroidota bacterium]
MERQSRGEPVVIGIAGGSGSGKTTVTNKIVEKLDDEKIVVIQHDSYYRDLSTFGGIPASDINFDHPDSLETPLLIRHLKELKAGRPIGRPIYDFTTHTRQRGLKRIEPKPIIFLEGILIYVEKELRDLIDTKIYVDTDADERFIRRLKRDIVERGRSIDSVIHQYVSTVKPMHLEFVEPSKRWADIIIPRGGENEIGIDMVVAKIKTMIDL